MAWPLEAFLSTLANLRKITVNDYRYLLRGMCIAWTRMGCEEPGLLTETALLEWCLVRSRELCPGGMYRSLKLADRFLCWMVREGYLLSNPLPRWLLERHRAGYTPRLVPDERKMRDLVVRTSELQGKTRLRDRAIVEVLYGCGLRNAELSGLDFGDWRNDELRVRGKYGAERVVPLGHAATVALRTYMDGERAALLRRFNPHERALFLGQTGNRLGTEGICKLFRDRLCMSVTAHQLRHACVTHMLRNGANIVVLRDLLGHRRMSTTRIYTEVKVEDVRKCLNKFHPRG
jgi:site-specific recombinase XerD